MENTHKNVNQSKAECYRRADLAYLPGVVVVIAVCIGLGLVFVQGAADELDLVVGAIFIGFFCFVIGTLSEGARRNIRLRWRS